MAKKGKKSKGKKGKKSKGASKEAEVPLVADEFDAMDLEQLKLCIVHTSAKLKEVKAQRNAFQIERDQTQQFYDVVHDEYIQTEAQIRNLETEMESMQETHLNDIRWYVSKVTHLELDHQNNLQQVQKESDSNRVAEDSRSKQATVDLKKERLSLKENLDKQLQANEQEVRNLVGLQQKEIKKLREEFEKQSHELYEKYQQKLAKLREDLDLQRKMEIHEIEERKNLHINDLMENHEKAFTEMRNYYNSITRDNLALIKSLKDELTELNAKAIQNEKTMEDISAENKKLSEPLSQAQAEVQELQHKLQNFEKDKRSLKLARARLLVLDHTLKTTTAQHEALEKKFLEVQHERDELYATFEETVLSVQQKSDAKNVLLQKKLDNYMDRFSRKKAQFDEVLSAANLDSDVLHSLTSKLDAVLDSKNQQIKNLRFDIARVTKAHDDLIRVYEAKLPELGVPSEDLGLQTLANNTLSAPAGLVVK